MAKVTPCDIKTANVNFSIAAENSAVVAEVEQALNQFMGQDSELATKLSRDQSIGAHALSSWRGAREKLKNLLLKNYEIVGRSNYDPSDYMVLLDDFLQKQFKIAGGSHAFLNSNPRRIAAASKLISNLVDKHEATTKDGKGKIFNIYEKAFLPITLFTQKFDRFGFIHRYITQVVGIIEDSRRRGSKYKSLISDSHSSYFQSIKNTIDNLEYVTKDWVLDGVAIRLADGSERVYLGSRKNDMGEIVHDVYDPSELGTISKLKYEVPEEMVSKSRISAAIAEKYSFEFANDVMAGQARNVMWSNELKPEHKEEIVKILARIRYKSTKLGNMLETDPEYASLKSDIAAGFKDVYEADYQGKKIKYVILKNDTRRNLGQESFTAYIISHSDRSTGESMNYFTREGEPNLARESTRIDVSREANRRGSLFRNGWYKAKNERVVGKRVLTNSTTGDLFLDELGGNDKQFDFNDMNLSWLENQPPAKVLMGKPVEGKSEGASIPSLGTAAVSQTRSFWEMVAELRRVYNLIGDELAMEGEKETKRLQSWSNKKFASLEGKVGKLYGKQRGEFEKFFVELNRLFGVSKNFWTDANGNIVTPNSGFRKIGDLYVPYVYENATIRRMLEEAIDEVHRNILKAELESNDKKANYLKERLLDLELSYAKMTDDKGRVEEIELEKIQRRNSELGIVSDGTDFTPSRYIVAQENTYGRSREEWTDSTLRKKDFEAATEYVDSVYYAFAKNRLMIDMLETIDKILSSPLNDQQKKDYLSVIMNRTKIAFNDPSSFAGIGKFDYSFDKIAKMMNKIPGISSDWDEDSARRWINNTKGTLSAMLLGHNGAIINRTQVINKIISSGWNMVERTAKILAGEDKSFPLEKAEAIIGYMGTDEVTSHLIDSLAHGGDISLSDAGLITVPGLPVPIPTPTWFAFMNMLRKGRDNYVMNGIPEIDAKLEQIEAHRIKDYKKRLARKEQIVREGGSKKELRKIEATLKTLEREYGRVTSPSEKRSIRELRELFLDIVMTPKDENNFKDLKRKYRKIMGEVADNRMKRIISWKLGWWFTGFGENMFTFTGSERYMRKQVVLMALLTAVESGALGKYDPKKMTEVQYRDSNGRLQVEMVPDVFLSDDAVRIARNAVNDTMFGMSSLHLGEAFNGFGAQLFLYKAYPLNQMIHDWKIVQTFMAGNRNKMDGVRRLQAAIAHYMNVAKNKYSKSGKYEYNPQDKTLDHEAIAVVRFLMSRVAMSVVAITTSMIPFLRGAMRSPLFSQINSMTHGGENPVIGVSFRLLTNALVMMSFDDEDKEFLDSGWDIARLFFPVFLTLPLNIIIDIFDG